jgi:hypothetical protein
MDWPVPYNWSAALGAPIGPMTWWSWHRPPLSEPVTDEGCVEAAALELELIGIVYGVLVEEIACADCGAPLDRSVKVELVRRTFAARRIVVATRCCGWQGAPTPCESGQTRRGPAVWTTLFGLQPLTRQGS